MMRGGLLHIANKLRAGFLITVLIFTLLPLNIAEAADTKIFLDVASGSNQTWNVPGDWSDVNTIELIAGGGGGSSGVSKGSGGGGGAYAKITNVDLTGGGTATYRVGLGGGGGTGADGSDGGDTWFNGVDLASASVGADHGNGGTATGGVGGDASSGGGSTKYAGGTGGTYAFSDYGTGQYSGGGGGGSAGPSGVGRNGGISTAATTFAHKGGGGGGGSGGASSAIGGDSDANYNGGAGGAGPDGTGGGVGGNSTTPSAGGTGTAGGGAGGGAAVQGNNTVAIGGTGGSATQFDALHGSGGGGGGGASYSFIASAQGPGGAGGIYGGGGGGGGYKDSNTAGGNGAQGLIVVTYTPVTDDTAPTPNPATFATVPDGASVVSVSMTATTASDADGSTPIEYSFAFTACSSDGGTGGTSSSWQTPTTYTDSGLQANQCYGYTVQSRDSISNTGTASSASEAYTNADAPGTPTVTITGDTTATLANDSNGNPSSTPVTLFALQVSATSPTDSTWDTKYIDASGDPSAMEVWLADSVWDTVTVGGLTAGTQYTVIAKARNGDGDETVWSNGDSGTTTETITKFVRLFGHIRLRGIRLR